MAPRAALGERRPRQPGALMPRTRNEARAAKARAMAEAGKPTKDIAGELKVAPRTVRSWLRGMRPRGGMALPAGQGSRATLYRQRQRAAEKSPGD